MILDSKLKPMSNDTLHVRIISPQQLILDTQAESISSKNLDGPFDVLPQHANFITMIEKFPITVRVVKDKPQIFNFAMSIMLVKENNVDIFTYIQPELDKKK